MNYNDSKRAKDYSKRIKILKMLRVASSLPLVTTSVVTADVTRRLLQDSQSNLVFTEIAGIIATLFSGYNLYVSDKKVTYMVKREELLKRTWRYVELDRTAAAIERVAIKCKQL